MHLPNALILLYLCETGCAWYLLCSGSKIEVPNHRASDQYWASFWNGLWNPKPQKALWLTGWWMLSVTHIAQSYDHPVPRKLADDAVRQLRLDLAFSSSGTVARASKLTSVLWVGFSNRKLQMMSIFMSWSASNPLALNAKCFVSHRSYCF